MATLFGQEALAQGLYTLMEQHTQLGHLCAHLHSHAIVRTLFQPHAARVHKPTLSAEFRLLDCVIALYALLQTDSLLSKGRFQVASLPKHLEGRDHWSMQS